MERYDSYKDSGVEWIGDIPSQWEIYRLGMLGTFSSSGIDKKSRDNEVPVRMVNYTDLVQSRNYYPVQNGEKDFMRVTTPKSKLKEHGLRKGDMVFIPSSETYEDLGYSSLIDFEEEDIVFSYHILRFQFKKEVYHYFKKYLVNHYSVLNQFSSEGKGTTRQIIGRSVFNNVKVVLPPLLEQNQIVSFLDTKTSLIDSLIEKTQRKIELLKEQRTSLINEVVTKGLNPDLEMKDSGVEWIGEIPSHWDVKQLKHIIKNLNSGTSVNSEDTPTSGNEQIGVLKTSCVYGDIFRPNENKKVVIEEYGRVKCPVVKDSIIISRMNTPELVGSNGYVEEDYPNLFLPDRLWITELNSNIDLSVKWLSYVTKSHKFKSELSSRSTGTSPSMKNITKDDLLTIRIPFTNNREQQQIVEYLDSETQLIDRTISNEEKRIELLKEYRQSLISEVVTGKIKVPGV